ncbi:MAG TPA: hypothetical protein VE958_13545, partial [Bryobacteraceae bacterium]|nr:hypothetical protein [Bryobacteraceae bacterium]
MSPRQSWTSCILLSAATFAAGAVPAWADPPKVAELRIQKVEQTTYFHVRFEAPADMRLPRITDRVPGWTIVRPELARLPRLVSQDGETRAVYLGLRFTENAGPRGVRVGVLPAPRRMPDKKDADPANPANPDAPIVVHDGTPALEGLEFFG